MIRKEELTEAGTFGKPHGVKGELSFRFTLDAFGDDGCPFLVCELDGIFVPFRLEEYRLTSGSTALVRLKGICSEEKARALTRKAVYLPKKYLPQPAEETLPDWDYFIGFTLIDAAAGEVGTVAGVDTSTLNTLFRVENNGAERFVPAAAALIVRIDENQQKIYMDLPAGLLDL